MTEEEEYFEDRAAIIEYDDGFTRADAEPRAQEETKRNYGKFVDSLH